MGTFLGIFIGIFSGLITGIYLEPFVCGYCEMDQYIGWISYVCYGAPIITGIVAGYNSLLNIPEDFWDIIFESFWDVLGIIFKVILSGVVIALVCYLAASIITFFKLGGGLLSSLVAAVMVASSIPVIRIYIDA